MLSGKIENSPVETAHFIDHEFIHGTYQLKWFKRPEMVQASAWTRSVLLDFRRKTNVFCPISVKRQVSFIKFL